MSKAKNSVTTLLWIMLFDHTSLNITFPVLTLLFFDLQTSLFAADTSQTIRSMWYGFCVSIPHLINILITPILSALSDEYGRKKILLIGTLGALVFTITAGLGVLWGSLSLLFLGRIIQGAFSRTNPIAQAVIGDVSDKKNKILYMGYLQTAISIGAFAGPIIGGYFANRFLFAKLNFSLPYFIGAIFAFISFIITLFYFNETLIVERQTKSRHKINLKTIKQFFVNKEILFISIILLLCQMSWSIYYQFIPPILKTYLGFNADHLGWFVGLIAFWLALATTLGIKFLDKFLSLKNMLIFSIYLIFLGLLLTLGFVNFKWQIFVWLAAIPTAVGDVIAYSCLITFYSNAVEKHEQGHIMGICFIIVAIMWAMTGILGGVLMSINKLLPLLIAPIGVLLAILVLHFTAHKK